MLEQNKNYNIDLKQEDYLLITIDNKIRVQVTKTGEGYILDTYDTKGEGEILETCTIWDDDLAE